MSLETESEYRSAVKRNANEWVPACGGMETESLGCDGRRYLYCWNPYLGEHRYIRDDGIIVFYHTDLPRNLR